MKNLKHILTAALALTGAASFQSCDESWLDPIVKSKIVVENTLKDYDDMNSLVLNVEMKFREFFMGYHYPLGMQMTFSDVAINPATRYYVDWDKMMTPTEPDTGTSASYQKERIYIWTQLCLGLRYAGCIGNRISNAEDNLTEEQKAAIDAKGEAIEARMQLVKKIYKDAITKQVNSTNTFYQNGKRKEVSDMDTFFEQIMKQNEQIDKQFGDLLNTANSYGIEKQHIAKLIGRGMLEFLSEQNKVFIDLYGHFGSLSKVGTKCQKQVDKLTEKYLNEMSKVM